MSLARHNMFSFPHLSLLFYTGISLGYILVLFYLHYFNLVPKNKGSHFYGEPSLTCTFVMVMVSLILTLSLLALGSWIPDPHPIPQWWKSWWLQRSQRFRKTRRICHQQSASWWVIILHKISMIYPNLGINSKFEIFFRSVSELHLGNSYRVALVKYWMHACKLYKLWVFLHTVWMLAGLRLNVIRNVVRYGRKVVLDVKFK